MVLKCTALALIGCGAFGACSTSIQHGQFRFRTFGNASVMRLTAPGITFEAQSLNHSRPTLAALNGASHLVTSAGTAALPFVGGVPAAAKAATIIPATLPVFRTNELGTQFLR